MVVVIYKSLLALSNLSVRSTVNFLHDGLAFSCFNTSSVLTSFSNFKESSRVHQLGPSFKPFLRFYCYSDFMISAFFLFISSTPFCPFSYLTISASAINLVVFLCENSYKSNTVAFSEFFIWRQIKFLLMSPFSGGLTAFFIKLVLWFSTPLVNYLVTCCL